MIDTVEKTYHNGYYLARYRDEVLCIIEINDGDITYGGDDWSLTVDDFHWIADEPLDLEQLLTNYNSSADLNKRLGDAISHVKGLSKEEFAQDIFDAGYAGPIVVM